jgi:hypothetical protein
MDRNIKNTKENSVKKYSKKEICKFTKERKKVALKGIVRKAREAIQGKSPTKGIKEDYTGRKINKVKENI